MNDNDFTNHPVSISEARGQREGTADAWRPRDILITLLRDIDSGALNAEHLLIGIGMAPEKESRQTGFYQAGNYSSYAQVGLAYEILRAVTTPDQP
jgi:hypothetical protein